MGRHGEADIGLSHRLDLSGQAAEHFAIHDGMQSRAKRLRDAASRIDGILSEAIAGLGSPLRVRSGRLVLDTHRGVELFGDFSHGERTLAAIDIVPSVFSSCSTDTEYVPGATPGMVTVTVPLAAGEAAFAP